MIRIDLILHRRARVSSECSVKATMTASALGLALLCTGCRAQHTRGFTPPSAQDALGQKTCRATNQSTRPLLVEWPAADRAMLEAASHSGLVAVRYDGCEMEVLSRCVVPGNYGYVATTHKRDEVRIRNEDALWAELPLGAARLEATLAREGQLNVDMRVVGHRTAPSEHVVVPVREAQCSGATHLITGITVGAFQVYTGAAISLDAGAQAGNIGAGGSLDRSKEMLRADGDFAACEAAPTSTTEPPLQCGALLRVELAPVDVGGGMTSDALTRQDAQREELLHRADRWDATNTGAKVSTGIFGALTLGGVVGIAVTSAMIAGREFDLDDAQRTADQDDSFFASEAERARARMDIERLDGEIDDLKRGRRISTGIAIGSFVGMLGAFGLSRGAARRAGQLRNRARLLEVGVMNGPGQAGLTLRGRF